MLFKYEGINHPMIDVYISSLKTYLNLFQQFRIHKLD